MTLRILLSLLLITTISNAQVLDWAHVIGGAGEDNSHEIKLDKDGNVFITGGLSSTADFDPSPYDTALLTSRGGYDIYLAKYDKYGNYKWAFSVGGKAGDIGIDMDIDSIGNIYLAGHFRDTVDFNPGPESDFKISSGNSDVFIAKYDSLGNYVWAIKMGGIADDVTESITLDGEGNIYATGQFRDTADFDPSNNIFNLNNKSGGNDWWNDDIFVATYSSSGDLIWAFGIGEAGMGDYASDITVDSDKKIYITGSFGGGDMDFDPDTGISNLSGSNLVNAFVAKYDSTGDYEWAFDLTSSGGLFGGWGTSIITKRENLYLAGFGSGSIDFDPSSGSAILESKGGASDLFIARYDINGNYKWASMLAGSASNECSLGIDKLGNIYLTGHINSSTDMNPGLGVHSLIPKGTSDAIVAKYDSLGNYIWAFNFGGSGDNYETGRSIIIDDSSNVFVSGWIKAVSDFAPGEDIAEQPHYGKGDLFLAKYSQQCKQPFIDTFMLSPSPHCLGKNTKLSVGGRLNSALAWKWYADSCGGALIDSGATITISSNVETTYYVKPEGGCITPVDCDSITVPVFISPVVLAGNDTIITCGSPIILSGSGTALSYIWSDSITNSVAFHPIATKTFTVTGTNSDGCSSSDSIKISVLPSNNINLGSDTLLCENDTLLLDAGIKMNYLWSTGDSVQTILVDGSQTGIGNFTYWVQATDSFGCTEIDTIVINVSSCTSVEENRLIGLINIYPNPVNDVLHIVTEENRNNTFELINSLGQIVLRIEASLRIIDVDVSTLLPGVYMLKDSNGHYSKVMISR